MQKMSELYGQDWLEGLMDGFTCPLCQKEASKIFNLQQKDVLSVKMCGIALEIAKLKIGLNIK